MVPTSLTSFASVKILGTFECRCRLSRLEPFGVMLAAPVAPWQLNSCLFVSIRLKIRFLSDFGLRISDFALCLCPARLFPLSRFFAFRFSLRIRVCSCPFVVQFHRFLFAWSAWFAVEHPDWVSRRPGRNEADKKNWLTAKYANHAKRERSEN